MRHVEVDVIRMVSEMAELTVSVNIICPSKRILLWFLPKLAAVPLIILLLEGLVFVLKVVTSSGNGRPFLLEHVASFRTHLFESLSRLSACEVKGAVVDY